MFCTIEEILKYKNPDVVRRFQKDFPDKAHRAEVVFADLMRFFWGTKKHLIEKGVSPSNSDLDFVYIMDEEMREIDQMWHVFLLYTRDYTNFCLQFFGEYLNHQPDLAPIFEKAGMSFETNLQKFLTFNFDLFGETVIRRWFANSAA